ncbi:MAG: nicotinate-nucleotide adenylyltransferase [Clostridiales bacterium]|nr:nicotinate-nucleotide adenylyltransferase [Clostridiales bacterium]
MRDIDATSAGNNNKGLKNKKDKQNIKSQQKRIGICGGTFDPVHYGHLIISEVVMDELNLDKVVFIPSGTPPHKREIPVTPAEHRYQMLLQAIAGNPRFELSRIEIDRPGYSYTAETLKRFSSGIDTLGIDTSGIDTSLYFITGADIMFEILTWRDPAKIFSLCTIATVLRPGYDNECFYNQVDFLRKEHNAIIEIVGAPAPYVAISSSDIRQRIRDGKSIRYLVPERVSDYIKVNHLYTALVHDSTTHIPDHNPATSAVIPAAPSASYAGNTSVIPATLPTAVPKARDSSTVPSSSKTDNSSAVCSTSEAGNTSATTVVSAHATSSFRKSKKGNPQ